MVTIALEFVFPYIKEVIMIDVSLFIVGTDARTCRDAAIGEDAGYGDACMAEKRMRPHVEFKLAVCRG